MNLGGVILGFVDGEIPLVLYETPFLDWRCHIPILPGGGGEDQPLSKRTAKCQHRTHYLIGRAPTCEHHIRYAARLANIDRLPRLPACDPASGPFTAAPTGVAQ